MIDVWTLVVESSGRREYDDPTVTVHTTERDAMDALRRNYDPEREFRFYPDEPDQYEQWVAAFGVFFNLDVAIEKHTVPHTYPELHGFFLDGFGIDMVLRHETCGESLCGVEDGDEIEVYARLINEHLYFNANVGSKCPAHPLNRKKEN